MWFVDEHDSLSSLLSFIVSDADFPDPGGTREPGCVFSLLARPEAFGLGGGALQEVGSMLEAKELKWVATDDESVAAGAPGVNSNG
jgi:hypothetical protein